MPSPARVKPFCLRPAQPSGDQPCTGVMQKCPNIPHWPHLPSVGILLPPHSLHHSLLLCPPGFPLSLLCSLGIKNANFSSASFPKVGHNHGTTAFLFLINHHRALASGFPRDRPAVGTLSSQSCHEHQALPTCCAPIILQPVGKAGESSSSVLLGNVQLA